MFMQSNNCWVSLCPKYLDCWGLYSLEHAIEEIINIHLGLKSFLLVQIYMYSSILCFSYLPSSTLFICIIALTTHRNYRFLYFFIWISHWTLSSMKKEIRSDFIPPHFSLCLVPCLPCPPCNRHSINTCWTNKCILVE